MKRIGEVTMIVALVLAYASGAGKALAVDPKDCPQHAAHGKGEPAGTVSPYAGEQSREIKALSGDKIAGLLEGHGLGLAQVAELNHYPGPKHVLELASQLSLSDEQRQKTQTIYDEMHVEAVSLGKQLIDKERALDSELLAGRIDEGRLQTALSEIARIEGQLRFTHVRAHLFERALLTSEQVARYDRLRGYTGDTSPDHPHK